MSSPASRLRVLLVALVVSLGSLALASSAFAGDTVPGGKVCPPAAETAGCGLGSVFDPNTTNIPYLGVAGEQIRLVKCGPSSDLGGADAEWLPQPVDWSGDPHHQPQLVTLSQTTISDGDATCFAAEYVSDKAGLAFIKLKIFDGSTEIEEHQFLAGWTRICGNTLTEVASPELGDPTGNGVFNARSGVEVPLTRGFGRLQVQLKLCLPMGSNFTGLFPGDNVTLPDDWVAFANQFARDRTPDRANDPKRWDIHDTQLTANDDIHVDNNTPNTSITGSPATCDGPNDPNTGQPIFVPFVGPDTVDNCLDSNAFTDPDTISGVGACDDGLSDPTPTAREVGSFSRVFGDLTTCPTVGPFDPNRPDETLLSDGQLNAGDAPLPAVRVDFEIAPPSGTGIDGVGILCGPGSGGNFVGANCTGVDKHVVRSRDGLGTSGPHNLDSPFYAAYIPATAAPDPEAGIASGVAGLNGANNFPAFLNTDNPYHYWDHTFDLSNFPPGGNVSTCNRFIGDLRVGPVGATTVAVYSDEHGEAQSWYDPGGFAGDGFFFDRIPGVIINANGGCDLQNVTTLGTSSITAIARYPYEPVTLPDLRSNAVGKTVNNLFNKSISCVNKGNVPDVARLCTITALDIDGQPFDGFVPGTERREIVCFSIQDGSSVAIERGFEIADDPRAGTDRTCGILDSTGHLQVIVFSSVGRPVDLIADFTDQEIYRDCFVDFTPGGAGNCIASGGTGGGTTTPPSGSTTGTTQTQTVVIPAHATSHAKFKVAYSRVVRPVHHRRYLQLRINGKSKKKTVRVRIRITDRKGRSRTVTRRVRINRAVRLYGLPLTGMKRIKVTVLG